MTNLNILIVGEQVDILQFRSHYGDQQAQLYKIAGKCYSNIVKRILTGG